jgi:hypothetical protein
VPHDHLIIASCRNAALPILTSFAAKCVCIETVFLNKFVKFTGVDYSLHWKMSLPFLHSNITQNFLQLNFFSTILLHLLLLLKCCHLPLKNKILLLFQLGSDFWPHFVSHRSVK